MVKLLLENDRWGTVGSDPCAQPRALHRAGGNPARKENNHRIRSLASLAWCRVIGSTKRRQRGSRVRIEHRNPVSLGSRPCGSKDRMALENRH